MEASVCIEQKGTVEDVTSQFIRVKIHRESSCDRCSASGMCYMGEGTERIIEISDFPSDIKIGDYVGVRLSKSMGSKAIVLGYLIPFLILITALFIYNSIFGKEWLTGLLSLGTLIPYFIILYLFRNRLRKTFSVSARKNIM